MSGPGERASGTCARWRRYASDGVPRPVETGSGPGGAFAVYADAKACIERAPAPLHTGGPLTKYCLRGDATPVPLTGNASAAGHAAPGASRTMRISVTS